MMSPEQILLSDMPPLIVCSLMVFAAAVLSVGGTLAFHRFFPHQKLKVHNDIAGPIFSTLGVVYAVLLGFMVVVVWQNFERTKLNAEKEVSCLANLYIDSEPFELEFKLNVRSGIGAYVREIISEWDLLEKGRISLRVKESIGSLALLYAGYLPKNETEKAFFTKSVDNINTLFELRTLRLIDARAGISHLLWFILITGGMITIIFTIFFGTDNLGAKIIMSTLLAVLIAIVLFTILEFSIPFSGSAKVSCESFKQLLLQLNI